MANDVNELADGADLPDREAAGQRREALGADGLPEAELGGFLGPVLRLGDGADVTRQACPKSPPPGWVKKFTVPLKSNLLVAP